MSVLSATEKTFFTYLLLTQLYNPMITIQSSPKNPNVLHLLFSPEDSILFFFY